MEKECICPHTTCPAYGDCKACTDFHRGRPYCTSEETRKLVDSRMKRFGWLLKWIEK